MQEESDGAGSQSDQNYDEGVSNAKFVQLQEKLNKLTEQVQKKFDAMKVKNTEDHKIFEAKLSKKINEKMRGVNQGTEKLKKGLIQITDTITKLA